MYVPSEGRAGTEKQLRIEMVKGEELPAEWDAITRRIYTDSARVVLMPLAGGYSATTFQVTSYDREGRKTAPTVLKISSLAFTDREELAYHRHVEKFILNNSTVIMGRATRGQYAGLRYNFLGITGSEGGLSWLADHYVRRPVEDVIPLFDTLFSNILKPWYGQPRAEVVRPYAEHSPLTLFPAILEDAERHLGITPEAETMPCPELGMDLPNPYRFLKTGYAERRILGCPWYTSIIHGDLNLNNILVDERENLYVIDFSETRVGDVVSDFARLVASLAAANDRLETPAYLARLLEFELVLSEARSMADTPRFHYQGTDPMVEKSYRILCVLRRYADRVTLFEEDLRPYLLGSLQWTYPIISFRQVTPLQRRFSASAPPSSSVRFCNWRKRTLMPHCGAGKLKVIPAGQGATGSLYRIPWERQIRRRLPHHDFKIARYHAPVQVEIEQLKILRGKLQGHRLRFSRRRAPPAQTPGAVYRG